MYETIMGFKEEFFLALVWSLAPAFILKACWNSVQELFERSKKIDYGQALLITLVLRLFIG